MKHIISHFKKVDPVLHKTILQFKSLDFLTISKSNDYLRSLCREIIGQQLSGKVAHVIFERFLKLFPEKKITAEKLFKIPDIKLRSVGMSWSKVGFLKDLAKKVMNKKLDLKTIDRLDNKQVAKNLTMVKGIGPWTCEMFLMFALGREDLFSHGDYGLRKAIKNIYKFKKDPTKKQIEKITAKWSPYRTYACLILWESFDIKLPV